MAAQYDASESKYSQTPFREDKFWAWNGRVVDLSAGLGTLLSLLIRDDSVKTWSILGTVLCVVVLKGIGYWRNRRSRRDSIEQLSPIKTLDDLVASGEHNVTVPNGSVRQQLVNPDKQRQLASTGIAALGIALIAVVLFIGRINYWGAALLVSSILFFAISWLASWLVDGEIPFFSSFFAGFAVVGLCSGVVFWLMRWGVSPITGFMLFVSLLTAVGMVTWRSLGIDGAILNVILTVTGTLIGRFIFEVEFVLGARPPYSRENELLVVFVIALLGPVGVAILSWVKRYFG